MFDIGADPRMYHQLVTSPDVGGFLGCAKVCRQDTHAKGCHGSRDHAKTSGSEPG